MGHRRARQPTTDARDLPLCDARRGEHPAEARCGCSTSPRRRARGSRPTASRIRRCRSRPRRPPSVRRDPRQPQHSFFLSESPGKLYFTRLSRDMHKLDVCVADTATGEVKTLDRGAAEHLHRESAASPGRQGTVPRLLVGTRRLGALLSLRCQHRDAEEPDHRRGIRHNRRSTTSTRSRA